MIARFCFLHRQFMIVSVIAQNSGKSHCRFSADGRGGKKHFCTVDVNRRADGKDKMIAVHNVDVLPVGIHIIYDCRSPDLPKDPGAVFPEVAGADRAAGGGKVAVCRQKRGAPVRIPFGILGLAAGKEHHSAQPFFFQGHRIELFWAERRIGEPALLELAVEPLFHQAVLPVHIMVPSVFAVVVIGIQDLIRKKPHQPFRIAQNAPLDRLCLKTALAASVQVSRAVPSYLSANRATPCFKTSIWDLR